MLTQRNSSCSGIYAKRLCRFPPHKNDTNHIRRQKQHKFVSRHKKTTQKSNTAPHKKQPYHYYWVKALLRFQEVILQSNSPLLAEVAKADAALASDALPGGQRCSTCWSAELADALKSIGDTAGLPAQGDNWADRVRQGNPLGCRTAVLDATLAAYDSLAWRVLEGAQGMVRTAELPPGVGRKHLTYYAYFKPPSPVQVPSYLRLDQELHKQIRQLARFRLGCHKLKVELGRHCNPPVPWQARTCSRCSAAHLSALTCAVDDEHHMIFECESSHICAIGLLFSCPACLGSSQAPGLLFFAHRVRSGSSWSATHTLCCTSSPGAWTSLFLRLASMWLRSTRDVLKAISLAG